MSSWPEHDALLALGQPCCVCGQLEREGDTSKSYDVANQRWTHGSCVYTSTRTEMKACVNCKHERPVKVRTEGMDRVEKWNESCRACELTRAALVLQGKYLRMKKKADEQRARQNRKKTSK